MKLKNKLEEYTESEFLDFVNTIWNVNVSSEEEHDRLIEHFSDVTEYPNSNDLIFYPEEGIEATPQGVIKVVKNWRAANGKPGFKPA
jgi:hypothetical protein